MLISRKMKIVCQQKLPLAEESIIVAHFGIPFGFLAREDDDPLSRYDSYVWMSGQRNER